MKLLAADVGGDLNYYSSMLQSTANGFATGFFGVVGVAHKGSVFYYWIGLSPFCNGAIFVLGIIFELSCLFESKLLSAGSGLFGYFSAKSENGRLLANLNF